MAGAVQAGEVSVEAVLRPSGTYRGFINQMSTDFSRACCGRDRGMVSD